MTENVDKKQKKEDFPDDDPMIRAQRVLAGFRPGMRMTITRLAPGYCSGFLEQVECYDDDPVDMEGIINKWGGKRLRLRLHDESGRYCGGADINLSSYPPRFMGRVVKPDDDWLPTNQQVKVPQPEAKQPQTAIQQSQPSMLDLLSAIQTQRNNDMQTLMKLLGKQTNPGSPEQKNPIAEFLTMAQAFKKIQGLFAGDSPMLPAAAAEPEEKDSSLEMFGQITQLITALKTPSNQAPPPSPRRIIADQPVEKVVKKKDPPKPLPQQLAEMGENDFFGLVLTTLDQMDQDKRDRLLGKLDGFLDQLMPSDDEQNDSGHEIDESPFNGNPDNTEDQDPGGNLQSDAGNDPSDWPSH